MVLGSRVETPLQLMEILEESMMEQVFPCSLWRHHAGASIHTAACGELNPGGGGYSLKEVWSMETPQQVYPEGLQPVDGPPWSEVPITISIEPSVVLAGEQVTLSCQLSDGVPSNTSVLWYRMENGRDAPLCSSSSLGGVVEQCQDEEQRRTVGHWQGRALLLVIRQVRVADEGTYVCAVNGSVVTQEATAHLNVTAIGYKPTLDRDLQEESMCRYTCQSKKWYPKPEVVWMNYGGDTVNVEAKTNVTWSERDHFTVQSTITVPCDNVDVVCVVRLITSKISRSGSMNEIIVPQSGACTYKGRISGSYVKHKVMWVDPQGEDLSSWAQTSILQEMDNIFATESSIEIPCGQPPPSFVAIDEERSPQIAQQSEKQKEIENQKKEIGECRCVPGGRACQLTVRFRGLHRVLLVAFWLVEALVLVGERRKGPLRKAPSDGADDIKVDGDTAHPNLSIAVDKKSFTYKSQAQKVSQNKGSFDSSVCVLGSEGFSSGKHYWEVNVEKSNDWDLGVARKSAPRKGMMSLSPKEGFWALGLSFNDYWARTDPWTRLVVLKNPRKVGVYLNCEEKILTFFNVTDMSVIFTFKDCAFSEEVYPFFKNSHKESTMRICSIKEE
ncbi:PREDICTED: butyrophilin subfamily 1 member A1-like [Leptosomus discolor]|uniref:butyrophilin subfamily 1 member A1-like n=1 Tax=Leptosomus discolor TaxID=188344 RepID=UPI000522900B|nr:PREDICTED: butyrophilin subfamily 1 member A1-like [Leptosomus discolor]